MRRRGRDTGVGVCTVGGMRQGEMRRCGRESGVKVGMVGGMGHGQIRRRGRISGVEVGMVGGMGQGPMRWRGGMGMGRVTNRMQKSGMGLGLGVRVLKIDRSSCRNSGGSCRSSGGRSRRARHGYGRGGARKHGRPISECFIRATVVLVGHATTRGMAG